MPFGRWLWICLCCLVFCATARAQLDVQPSGDSHWSILEQRFEQRLARQPDDASAWRMLGRIRLQRGDRHAAFEAFSRSVRLDPLSAAAHFDLGRMLLAFDRPEEAREQFLTVVELAPESEYANDARQRLDDIAAMPGMENVEQAGYEVKSFTGADEPDEKVIAEPEPLPPSDPLYFRVETGVLYNSNVALTPIDRELSPDASNSAQAFVAPEVEFYALDTDTWRAGPAFAGYFSLNEGGFRELNVQNYQPGVFVERTVFGEMATLVPRLQYDFTHDEFDGQTFGNRHAMTASTAAHWKNGQKSFVYWTIDHTDFLDDGAVPSISSRDGWTNALGLSHKYPVGRRHLRSLRGGLTVQRADVNGSDFAFNGVGLFGEADVPITDDCWLLVQLGWGYRDYFDFEFSPSRNEHIWQAGLELRRRINEHLVIAGVVNYDRFDSENVLFEAERFISGIVLTIER